MLDGLAKEMAHTFGLGASASPLLNAYLNAIETDCPGGWSAYLKRFRDLGYGMEVANWLGNGPNQTITAEAIEEVFGIENLNELSERTGVNIRTCSEALAYATPEIIDSLSPNGVFPESVPAWAAGTIQPTHRPIAAVQAELWAENETPIERALEQELEVAPQNEERPRTVLPNRFAGWTTPLALGAIVLVISWFASHSRPSATVVASTSTQTPTRVLSDAVDRTPSQLAPPTLSLTKGRRSLTYTATVRDEKDRDELEAILKNAGATGTIEVDLGVARAQWLPALAEVIRDAPRGLVITLVGKSISLSGLSSDKLDDEVALLQDRLTPDFPVSILNLDPVAVPTNDVAMQAFQALETQAKPALDDWFRAANSVVINFRSGGVSLPDSSQPVLDKAVSILKAIDPDQVILIAGYTDSSGSKASNQRLSERRAQAVRDYFIKQGISSDKLVAKGFGPDNPVASNDTPSGRAANRRIEFRIDEPTQ